eukprot:353727-Chlamydomonas_euryale.AAC.3
MHSVAQRTSSRMPTSTSGEPTWPRPAVDVAGNANGGVGIGGGDLATSCGVALDTRYFPP